MDIKMNFFIITLLIKNSNREGKSKKKRKS